ncbi:MAG: AAA family ATPase [Candidatus Micrarchaeaceae archaeon]
MGKVALLVGISGAGKSTLIKSMPASQSYMIVNLGTLMFKIAEEEGLVSTRDQLKKLTCEESTRLRNLAIQEIKNSKDNLLIDTHISIENAELSSITVGIPFDLVNEIKPSGLIYIDAPSTDILERRVADTTRARENQTAYALDTQRTIDLSILSYYMAYLNIPLYIIINKQGRLQEATMNLEKAIEALFGK